MGKGGGGSQGNQTTSTAYNTNIPQYAQPYVENMLGAAQKQLFNTREVAGTPGTRTQSGVDENNNPIYSTTDATPGYTELTGFKQYQPYSANPSDYVAGFSPLQQRGFDSIANMQVAPQIAMGTDFANKGATGGMNSAPVAYNYGAQGSQAGQQGLGIGTAGGAYYGSQGANLAGANLGVGAMGMQAGMGYGQGAQNPNAVQGYMNPYLQASLQPQLQEMQRQYGISGAQQQSNATRAGAFGGSREALAFSENQRNKNMAMNQAIGQGYNTAYDVANRNMQAASSLGMQGAQVGLAGLQGANQNYLTGLQGVNTALAGTAQGMQGAQTGLQGVAGAQAGYGLGIQGANSLNALANTQYNQEMGIAQAQLGAGGQQQQYQQQIINQGVQDYANAQQYPLMQLGTMSNMLRGLPMQAQTTNQYMAAPNQLTQGIGAAGSLAYMNSAMQPRTAAKGGIMQAFDVGGSIKADLENMSLQQLQQYKSQSASPEAKRMTDELIREKMMEAQLQKQQPQRMARGGIAEVQRFQKGELTELQESFKSQQAEAERGDLENALLKEARHLDSFYGGALGSTRQRNDARTLIKDLQGAPIDALRSFKATGITPKQQQEQNQYGADAPGRTNNAGVAEVVAAGNRNLLNADADSQIQGGVTPDDIYNASLKTFKNSEIQDNEQLMQDADSQVQPTGIAAVSSPSGAPQVAAQPNVPGVNTQGAIPQGAGAPQGSNVGIAGVPTGGMPGGMPGGIKGPKEYSLSDAMKEVQDAKQEAGLGENKGAQEQRARLMAERANLGDEAARQQKMRMAEFFASWGTTPGNTLVAGMQALKKTIPDLISDDREQAKARKEADKALYDLDQAVRAEKLGDFDKAATFKEKAADRANQLNMKLIDYQGDMAKAGATVTAAQLREKSEDARLKQTITHQTEQDRINNKRVDVAAAAQKTAAEKAEAQQAEIERKNLEVEHFNAERLALQSQQAYKTQQTTWDKFKTSDEWKNILLYSKLSPKGADENQKNNIADAIAKKAAYEAEHQQLLNSAKETEAYYKRLARSKIPKTSGATNTEKPLASAFD